MKNNLLKYKIGKGLSILIFAPIIYVVLFFEKLIELQKKEEARKIKNGNR